MHVKRDDSFSSYFDTASNICINWREEHISALLFCTLNIVKAVCLHTRTFNHLILSARKEVRMSRTECQTSHNRYVAGESYLQCTWSKIPYLHACSISVQQNRVEILRTRTITFIVLSPAPVAKNSLDASTETERTQPKCPLITYENKTNINMRHPRIVKSQGNIYTDTHPH